MYILALCPGIHERKECLVTTACICNLWSPTGFGKTLHFQVLPFVMNHKLVLVCTEKSCSALIISPLVALMMDQPVIRDPNYTEQVYCSFACTKSLHK